MLDYQFLGLVAVVMAVVTRGSVLPVVVVTAFIGLVTLAFEASAKLYRRHHPQPAAGSARAARPGGDRELNRWMAAAERVLGSKD
jgi:hypothetical protein